MIYFFAFMEPGQGKRGFSVIRKPDLTQIKRDIITICGLIHQKGFVAATDGNVSVRLGENRFIITPSQFNKGLLTEDDLITIDSRGKVLKGKHSASSEYLMHIRVYQLRPDVNAVIHAHPPYATAFSISGKEIPSDLLPELVLTIGKIPTSHYATPSTPEVARVISDLIPKHDAIILARHGSLTTGKDIFSAYNRLEKIEQTAKIALIAETLGNVQHLNEETLEKLTYMAHRLGMRKDLSAGDSGED